LFKPIRSSVFSAAICLLLLTTGCSQISSMSNKGIPAGTPANPQIQSPANPGQSANSQTMPSSPNTTSPDNNTPAALHVNRDLSIPVLYYHSVSTVPKNEICMPPSEFEKQMAYLSEQGYHTVSVTQIYDFFTGKGTLPDKPIAITFDDGYKDNYTNAFPTMKKYGFTGTIFVIAENIGSNNILTWDDLKALIKEGWQIGGHSMTHVDLTKLDSPKLTEEVKNSKLSLEKKLEPIKSFCYPFGAYNAKVEKAVQDAGYLIGFTTDRGWADRKTDLLLQHRIYCFASMGMKEFEKRLQNPNY